MDLLRDAIVGTLQVKFPTMRANIRPFTGLLDEQSEAQISHRAPSIMVCALNCQEAPDDIAPFELRANCGLVVTVDGASAVERDKVGWRLCIQVCSVVYANTWGISPFNIRGARLTNIQKNEARNPNGTPTGINYWTIQFYNWIKFEALLP